MREPAYMMGQLLNLLISAGWADDHSAVAVTHNLRGTLLPAIARATGDGENGEISALVTGIGEMPEALSNEQQSSFWLGFYHRKRGPGRPPGSVKPEGRKETHGITISDEAWDKAKATGNASGYIERLITEDG